MKKATNPITHAAVFAVLIRFLFALLTGFFKFRFGSPLIQDKIDPIKFDPVLQILSPATSENRVGPSRVGDWTGEAPPPPPWIRSWTRTSRVSGFSSSGLSVAIANTVSEKDLLNLTKLVKKERECLLSTSVRICFFFLVLLLSERNYMLKVSLILEIDAGINLIKVPVLLIYFNLYPLVYLIRKITLCKL